MIPTAFDYQRATSLNDALAKLKAAGAGAKIIAGGHSLIPLMKLRLSEPRCLIDITRIPELRGIHESAGRITIGAATTHHEVATSPVLQQHCPVLSDAASMIGDQQVRNRGTIGGSLAHSDPSADYPAVMLALDADVQLAGPKGRRVVKAQDFFQDLLTVDLAADEILAAVQLTPIRTAAYAKLVQRASHYAIVGVAAALHIVPQDFSPALKGATVPQDFSPAPKGSTIASARVGLTGGSSHAQRMTNVEEALVGRPASRETIAAASRLAGVGLESVNADIHASEEYRRAMMAVFTRRALDAALARQ
jgi:carbon-monoxide dehydrogenase medium subunit